ncbi:MAG: NfeD family protein [Leptospirales bacterium]|nr:NfeD family protein [Leptospirales bacterium]
MESLSSLVNNSTLSAVVWASAGIALVIAEFFVPGAICVFLGLGALLTGGFTYLGALNSLTSQFVFWVFSSLVLILILRARVTRWFPALERDDSRAENDEIAGRLVEVLEDIAPGESEGRVRFQGASWNARSEKDLLRRGEQARILRRDNLWLVVEASDETPPQTSSEQRSPSQNA